MKERPAAAAGPQSHTRGHHTASSGSRSSFPKMAERVLEPSSSMTLSSTSRRGAGSNAENLRCFSPLNPPQHSSRPFAGTSISAMRSGSTPASSCGDSLGAAVIPRAVHALDTATMLPHRSRNTRTTMALLRPFLLMTLLLSMLAVSWGFNLSPEAALVFEDPQGGSSDPDARSSYFGYSVGLRSRNSSDDNWLLVGAPRANLTRSPLAPVGLVEPGTVYRCPVGGSECRQLLMDDTGNTAMDTWHGELGYQDLKNHGWLGGAMDTQDSDREYSMVCAPLWKNQLYKGSHLMNGACYAQSPLLEDATALKRLPLTQFSKQNYQMRGSNTVFHYAHGELGLSIHFPEDKSKVLLGAPGVFNWQGTVVLMYDAVLDGNSPISKRRRRRQIDPPVNPQQTFSIAFVPNPYFTASIGDSDYFGYSVSSGMFVKGEEEFYVAGAPRGASAHGKVLVFQMGQTEESELNILVERSGSQIGEYFGASVAAVDLDNNGLADLVVGAPQYSTTAQPDHGAIYVYRNNGGGQLPLHGVRLEGSKAANARFGSVVMSPGDLNKDGYNDVVVGAPYEGPGAVYVYLGSVDGLQHQYSQRISAETLTTPSGKPLEGFGISISRGVDVDDNLYPDLAVGSYVSGHAVLLRTRPVAVLRGSTTTSPTRLSLDDTSFIAKPCITYRGIGVPQQQEVTVSVTLDHERLLVAPRAFFTESGTAQHSYNVTLRRDGTQCKELQVKVQAEQNNYQDPIGIRLQYWLANPVLRPSELGRPITSFLAPDGSSPSLGPITSPVTDPSERSGRSSFLNFVTGCEDDGVPSCLSDLKVTTWYPSHSAGDRLVVGEENRVKVAVKVENLGEPAFLPNVTLSVKRPLDLLLPSTHTCERLGTDNPTIVCRLKNPLKRGEQDSLQVEVDVEQLSDSSSAIQVDVTAGSSDVEVTPGDNSQRAALQLTAKAQLQLHGSSSPEQVTYERSSTNVINMTTVKELTVTHSHTIVKKGPTRLGEVILMVEIPVKDADNNTLLTVYAPQREFQGEPFSCHLRGATWVSAKKGGSAVNLTLAGDSEGSGITATAQGAGQQKQQSNSDVMKKEEVQEVEHRDVPYVSCRKLPQLKCAVMTCRIGSWPPDSASASLSFKLKLNLTTLGSLISVKDGTTLETFATASMNSLSIPLYSDGPTSGRGTAHSTILPGRLAGEGFPWWWLLLAVLLGLLLLTGLIYGLHKMGFFRRKEQEEMAAQTAILKAGAEHGTSD